MTSPRIVVTGAKDGKSVVVSDGPATKRSDQSERDSGQCRNATVHGNLPIGRVLSTVYNVRRPLAVTLLPDRTGRTNERAGVCRWG